MLKTVTQASVEVAVTSRLRGFLDEYGDSSADVLFLEGEIHSGTKPVSDIVCCVEVVGQRIDIRTHVKIGSSTVLHCGRAN